MTKPMLDAKDQALLTLLRENARAPTAELEIGRASCRERV